VDFELRAWVEDDAPALGAAIAESFDHLRPFLAFMAHEPLDPEARRAWIRELDEGEDDVFGMWVGDRVAGGVGLHQRIGPSGLEIGYWVARPFTRRGFATEAAALMVDLAFSRSWIDHVEIHHDRANVASRGVPRALGFELVEERTAPPRAEADTGMTCVWRLVRADVT
jgi:ribosomal-protein-serine acetyltransferase